tara:strand:+ start:380 stop:664 length:285 start_codon:yes stop_codon:yes gene_type:complete
MAKQKDESEMSEELLRDIRELSKASASASIQEKLFQLGTKDWFDILMWIANDLYVWKSDTKARDEIKLHSAMLYECLEHQINKAIIRINREEEA